MGSVLAAVEKSGRVHSASPAASSGPPAPPLGTWYVAPGFGLCGQCGLLPFGLMILFDLSFVILCDIRMGKACMHVGFMVIDDFPPLGTRTGAMLSLRTRVPPPLTVAPEESEPSSVSHL